MMFLTSHASERGLDVGVSVLLAGLLLAPFTTRVGRARLREAANTAAGRVLRSRRVVALGTAAALIAALAAFLPGRPPSRARSPGPRRPNVLVIAVDSLRANRVFSPDEAARFPTIAGLARSGVRFRQAYVAQARTFPSFVTLLTGRYPQHHGIRHEFPTREARQAIGPSLPSALRTAGWRTAAVSDFAGEIFSRVPLGFDDVDAPVFDIFGIVDEAILGAHVHVLPYAASRPGEKLFPAMSLMAEFDDPALLADRALQGARQAGRAALLSHGLLLGDPHALRVPGPLLREVHGIPLTGVRSGT